MEKHSIHFLKNIKRVLKNSAKEKSSITIVGKIQIHNFDFISSMLFFRVAILESNNYYFQNMITDLFLNWKSFENK